MLVVLLIVFIAPCCNGQINFSDTIREYNKQRIVTNVKGMNVLGAWGIANMAVGGIGYFTANDGEWKYFHGMNAAWGLVNTGIATYGLQRARKQAQQKVDMRKAYYDYRHDKNVILVNMGLDVVYIGAGAYLAQYATTDHNNPQLYRGFGRSLLLQGAFLLAFDNVLLLSHHKNSGHWATILDEMRFTGNGFSYVHTF